MIISVGAEKAFDRIPHPLLIHKNKQRKKLRKLEIEGNLFNRIKARDEPIADIILGVERLKAFHLR